MPLASTPAPMSKPDQPEPKRTRDQLEAARREKLRKLVELGIDPWGGRFEGHARIADIRVRAGEITESPPGSPDQHPELHGPKVRAAGRVVLARDTGKLIFLNIRDWTGDIQLFIGKKQVGEQN